MRSSALLSVCWFVGAVTGCGDVKARMDAPSGSSDTGTDVPTECPIGAMAICSGNDLASCDGAGNITGTTPCTLGCSAAENRCMKVNPSNGLASYLDSAASAPDFMLMGDATIDTDAGTITDGTGARTVTTAIVTATPVSIFVIEVKSFRTGGNVTVTGSKALAIVSDDDVTIGHVLSASASKSTPGAGAVSDDFACRGGNAPAGNAEGEGGGGGGGFGAPGGAGGVGGNPSVAGGTAGGVSGTPELVPLRGGCPGGRPGSPRVDNAPGAGGGAIQIVSNTAIKLLTGGAVAANGGGGKGPGGLISCVVGIPCGDGEGGGSGGAILLEAPAIDIPASTGLYVNGGSGSCSLAGFGRDGTASLTPAPGESCMNQTGSGGAGGAGSTNALDGVGKLGDNSVGGGGGGGRGRIRINLPAGVTFSPVGDTSGVLSVGELATH